MLGDLQKIISRSDQYDAADFARAANLLLTTSFYMRTALRTATAIF